AVRRDGTDVEMKVTLTAGRGEGTARGGFGGRAGAGGRGGAGPKGGAGERGGGPGGRAGFARGSDGPPPATVWKKEVFRLAVVGIEYPDVKHNAAAAAKDWDEAIFSRGAYRDKAGPTGQPVHGSLADYFAEQSYGALKVEGQGFDWVEWGKQRAEY